MLGTQCPAFRVIEVQLLVSVLSFGFMGSQLTSHFPVQIDPVALGQSSQRLH